VTRVHCKSEDGDIHDELMPLEADVISGAACLHASVLIRIPDIWGGFLLSRFPRLDCLLQHLLLQLDTAVQRLKSTVQCSSVH
jgi:hypothetical protein